MELMQQTVDPTADFFAALAAKDYEPLLANATGSLRFDVVDEDAVVHWHVVVDKGAMTVTRHNRRADVVVRLDRSLSDRITSGEQNAMAALLRGELVPVGDLRLVMMFQRLFPGPGGEGTVA
jgi:putative sterol carrier protein